MINNNTLFQVKSQSKASITVMTIKHFHIRLPLSHTSSTHGYLYKQDLIRATIE